MPYKLASRAYKKTDTVVKIKDVEIGSNEFVVVAGPCSIENAEQFLSTAKAVRDSGAHLLRGAVFKPRSSPYSFQGLGADALDMLGQARKILPIVTEVMEPSHVDILRDYVDVYQIGARNMQNFSLLKKVGKAAKPVLLKRGFSSTIEEWLMAAEYILSEGNQRVILCERGIRTFEPQTRNTLDISAIPLVKELSHLPIIVDPSHATGKRSLIPAMCRASLAAGAHGLMIEVHPNPESALSDNEQQLNFEQFGGLMEDLKKIAGCFGKEM